MMIPNDDGGGWITGGVRADGRAAVPRRGVGDGPESGRVHVHGLREEGPVRPVLRGHRRREA